MKKKQLMLFGMFVLVVVFTISWNGINAPNGTNVQLHASFMDKTNVLQISPAGNYDWYVLKFDLGKYEGQRITIDLSMLVWLNSPTQILWQINSDDWPLIAGNHSAYSAGRWHTIQGSQTLTVQQGHESDGRMLFLSTMQFGNTTAYFADLVIKVNGQVISNDIVIDNTLSALHTKWPFRVGAAVGNFSPINPQTALLRHFNVLVAEYIMKPSHIMPEPWMPNGAYRWAKADKLVEYAEANGKGMRGHVLFWHEDTPDAFFRGSGRDGRASINELYARMENHARTVFQKYRGRIEWWDVCNEVVGENGGPRPGGNQSNTSSVSLYSQIMQDAGKAGMDRYEYVLKAFQWARQYADANGGQNVKLFLTDYLIELPGAKQTEFLRLLDYLIANNAPIDGIGVQGHYHFDWPNIRDISRGIDAFAAKQRGGKNLIVQVTEFDLTLFTGTGTDNRLILTDRELNTRLGQQARRYRELFDVFEQKYREGKLDMVLFWGIDDGSSWKNYIPVQGRFDHALLFDRNYQPKAAFHELISGR